MKFEFPMTYCLEADGQAESQLHGCNCDFKKRRFVDVLKEGMDSGWWERRRRVGRRQVIGGGDPLNGTREEEGEV